MSELRDRVVRAMAVAIPQAFDDFGTNWIPQAEAALDAALDVLGEWGIEWVDEEVLTVLRGRESGVRKRDVIVGEAQRRARRRGKWTMRLRAGKGSE